MADEPEDTGAVPVPPLEDEEPEGLLIEGVPVEEVLTGQVPVTVLVPQEAEWPRCGTCDLSHDPQWTLCRDLLERANSEGEQP